MGESIDCEHGQLTGDTASDGLGVTVQNTTRGMAYYVPRSNTVAFIPDFGAPATVHDTWALANDGLLYFWRGNDGEPPADAVSLDPAACDTLVQVDASFAVACLHFFEMTLGNPLTAPPAESPRTPLQTAPGALLSQDSALALSVTRTPSDDQLRITLSQVDAALGERFPEVTGRVCNGSANWDATDVTVNFVFYDRNRVETVDSGSYRVGDVLAGQCASFDTTLTALNPWRTIGLRRTTWTWQR